jgi:hypothetical protein
LPSQTAAGAKFKAATKWNTKPVRLQWVLDCAQRAGNHFSAPLCYSIPRLPSVSSVFRRGSMRLEKPSWFSFLVLHSQASSAARLPCDKYEVSIAGGAAAVTPTSPELSHVPASQASVVRSTAPSDNVSNGRKQQKTAAAAANGENAPVAAADTAAPAGGAGTSEPESEAARLLRGCMSFLPWFDRCLSLCLSVPAVRSARIADL